MPKILFLLTILISFFTAQSQNLKEFERLKSEGEIPDFFVKYLDEKIAQDNKILKENDRISNKNAEDFSAKSNYMLQRLIQSGRVLYGDPLTKYANKVLDQLKSVSEHDLDHIQIYTLKSNEVNAFATDQGVIFITLGLLGQLENEAQLAFVLAHELTHVIETHNQLAYQHTQDLSKNSYGTSKISKYYQYSKDHEEDADKAGFKLATKAGYKASELFSTFNVLLYSYLPIDEYKIDFSWIENEGFKVTDMYILEEPNEISAQADVDDEFHSHPNINNRRINIKSLYNAHKRDEGSKVFIISEVAEFERIRDLARFGMMNTYVRNANYIDGLYHNIVLQHKYPNNTFLKNTQAMIWYGITAYENSSGKAPYSTSYRKKEGEIQHLYYFLHKLKDHEMATIATKQVWEASMANPESEFLLAIREKTVMEWVKFEKNSIAQFASEIDLDDDGDIQIEDDENLSKYDKIAKKKKTETRDDFTYYAFLDILKDPNFIDEVDQSRKKAAEKKKRELEFEENYTKPEESTLDIKTLIMTTPNFYKKDNRKSAKKTVSKNELNETLLVDLVKENSEKLGIELNFIDNFKAPNFDTDKYNDFSLLYDYLGERYRYSDLDFLPYNAQYISTIKDQYNSKYVGSIGIYTEIEKREFNASAALLSAVVFYLFPLYLKWQLSADKATDYSFMVFDLETHNPAYVSSKFFDADMNIHLQNAHIYNSLNQIKKKK